MLKYSILGEIIKICTTDIQYHHQLQLGNQLLSPTSIYTKVPHIESFIPPNIDFLLQCVPSIYSWIHDRITTTIRAEKTGYDQYEIRFYRNTYLNGLKYPLIYSSLADITREISRGAFCWIPDAHHTIIPNQQSETPENITFTGPIYVTFDIDTAPTVSYNNAVESARNFSDFLYDSCRIIPHYLTSGNRSLHLRFELSYPTVEERGYLLPKITQWNTYYRRRHCEFPLQTVRDALLILLCAYNFTRPKIKIGCDLPGFRRYKHYLFYDLRCGLHQGARIPGAYHQKSNRYCALIPRLFDNEWEIYQFSTEEYLSRHIDALFHPNILDSERHSNLIQLLSFTNEWYENHLTQLLEDHIFHSTEESE